MDVVAKRPEHIGRSSAMLALYVSAVWGGNVVALKIGLATLPPFWSAFWRFTSGLLAVIVWAKSSGIRLLPAAGEGRLLGILAALFMMQITAMNLGVDMTSPAYGVILLNSHPIFTNLISHFVVPEDRLSGQRVLGLTIAFGGICYLAMGRPDASLAPEPFLGNVFVVTSAALLASRMVYTQRLVQTVEPVRAVVWQMLFSLPAFLGLALLTEPATLKPVGAEPVLAILYQGVMVAGFCFVMWTRLLQRHSPGSLSVFAFSVPIFGVVLSALLVGEAITARVIVGVAAVTAGIVIVNRRRPEGAPLEPEQSARQAVEEALR